MASADEAFAALCKDWSFLLADNLKWILSLDSIARALAFICIAGWLIMLITCANEPLGDTADEKKPIDTIVASIVLGGIILVYAIFIALQVERLLVDALPLTFADTELLVKSGFWQLLALTSVNIALTVVFLRGDTFVRVLLGAFLGASVLLLVSAAHRMFLYIFFYGLSHEKFFAGYTVIYCAIVFGYLSLLTIQRYADNTIRFFGALFLWMYAFATALPVESIIVHTNLQLVKRADSRLALWDLSMMSGDVLYAIRPEMEAFADSQWASWRLDRRKELERKRWFEQNLSAMLNVYLDD